MGVVAEDAPAGSTVLGMIGPEIPVATGACLLRRSAYVVRRVTARALVMLRNARRAENGDMFVAGTASHRRVLIEAVRAVATDALGVSIREERGLRDQRRVARMTL